MNLEILLLRLLAGSRTDTSYEKFVAEDMKVSIDRVRAACLRLQAADLVVDAGPEQDLGVSWEPNPMDVEALFEKAKLKGIDLSEPL